jgi:hypothetical protein
MKRTAITVSEKIWAYSAAVIADAQATIARAVASVQRADNTRTRVKKRRESAARAKSR